MQRLMYPLGNAYRSETGGLMEALRVLSVEQSKKHRLPHVLHRSMILQFGDITARIMCHTTHP